jgi:hypothetical protein
MSGLETDRYEYSNLGCDRRVDGEEDPYKLRLCLHFLCMCMLPFPLAQPTCVLSQVTGKNVLEDAKARLGQQNLLARMFFFAKCATNTEKYFLFAFIAQASVAMDRYRGLCCWYISITISLFLCSLVHVLRRPCLPAMTNIVVSARRTRVGLVTT